MGFNLSKEIGSVSDSVVKISIMLFVIWVLVILFGNLSGSSGFTRSSESFTNNSVTIYNTTGAEVLATVGKVNPSLSISIMVNGSNFLLSSGNYTTVLGSVFLTPNSEFENLSNKWNATGSFTYEGSELRNSEDILNNATGGMLKIVNFSNNWFTILGIGLLIVILIGLLVKAVGGFGSVTGAGRGGRFGSA